jgi:hypothetical protein
MFRNNKKKKQLNSSIEDKNKSQSTEAYKKIIKNKGKNADDWNEFLNIFLDEKANKSLVNEIHRSFQDYKGNKIIYDIIDYILEMGVDCDNSKQIFDAGFSGIFARPLNDNSIDKTIKIKILFLIKKWGEKQHPAFVDLYKGIKEKKLFLFPPKNFPMEDYHKYFINPSEKKTDDNEKIPTPNNQKNYNNDKRGNNNDYQTRNINIEDIKEENSYCLLSSQINENENENLICNDGSLSARYPQQRKNRSDNHLYDASPENKYNYRNYRNQNYNLKNNNEQNYRRYSNNEQNYYNSNSEQTNTNYSSKYKNKNYSHRYGH